MREVAEERNGSATAAGQFRPNSIEFPIVTVPDGEFLAHGPPIPRFPFAMKLRAATLLLLAAFALSSHDACAAPLSMQEAIAKVQHQTGGKVLSAETKTQGKKTIYRIKVLTRDGQVRIIEVPAE